MTIRPLLLGLQGLGPPNHLLRTGRHLDAGSLEIVADWFDLSPQVLPKKGFGHRVERHAVLFARESVPLVRIEGT